MEALNIVFSLLGGMLASLFTLLINAYLDRKMFLRGVCEFIEELTLNRKGAYSNDVILIKLKNFDTQIQSRFNKKIAKSYSQLYGDIVQCIRLNADITENAITESYVSFLQNIKLYFQRRFFK